MCFRLPPLVGSKKTEPALRSSHEDVITCPYNAVRSEEAEGGSVDPPYPFGCEAFDFDGDGDVDLLDFAAFQRVLTAP